MSSAPAIRIQQLGKCYQIYDKPADRLKQSLWRGRRRYFREFWALQDVAFEVGKGETVGIIGRNGSGKSTLLQMIAGTLTPTTGSIDVRGRLAALLELGSGFNPEFTGRENVFMNAAILGLEREETARRFAAIAAFADIGDFIDQPVKTYSSGMVVRLAFAVSVNIDPDILVIDEALSVGDMAFQYKCMERLERLTKNGTTLLFVSHDIGTVKAFCDRAVYLKQGRVRGIGPAGEMAELYMLDIKDDHKRALENGAAGVALKPALGGDQAIAFGTTQGRVARAWFGQTGGAQAVYSTGEPIEVVMEVEFDASLDQPAVSLIVCDYRMIELAGRYFRVAKRPGPDGITRAAVRFALGADFNAGNYFVTLRLEERIADNNLIPVDKQVGALSFSVVRPPHSDFIGLVRQPIEAAEIAPAAC